MCVEADTDNIQNNSQVRIFNSNLNFDLNSITKEIQ